MRALLAVLALASVAIVTAPFVMADGPAEEQAHIEGKICPGTFGEYRVHCLVGLEQLQG